MTPSSSSSAWCNKLQENMQRLAALHERQTRDITPAHPEAAITPARPKPAEAGFRSRGTASVPDSLKGEIEPA